MKKALTLAALALAGIVLALPPAAGAATPQDRKIAALQKQVAALTKRVKKLETREKEDRNVISAALVLTACNVAATADALAGTWNVIDQISSATQAGKTYFGPQPFADDGGACQAFQIQRSQAVPPTLVVFQAILKLFTG